MKRRNKIKLNYLLFAVLFITISFFYLFSPERDTLKAQSSGTHWAILVGVSNYMKKEVPPLNCAVNDAKTMKELLIKTSGFREENIILLSTDHGEDKTPTKVNISKSIGKIRDGVKPGDTVLFFFSGHGIWMEDEGYILTFEADPDCIETLEASCMEISKLKKQLGRIKADTLLTFIDACRDDPTRTGQRNGNRYLLADDYPVLSPNPLAENFSPILSDNGDFSKGLSDNTLIEDFAKNLTITAPEDGGGGSSRLYATFFSCDVGEKSYEWAENALGFFTYYLVMGIRGEARDKAGNVTLKSLEDYLKNKVPSSVQSVRKGKQNPRVTVNNINLAENWVIWSPGDKTAEINMPYPGQLVSLVDGKGTPKGIELKKKHVGEKFRFTLNIITNDVETREYDKLNRRIETKIYSVDKDMLYKDIGELFIFTNFLELTDNEEEVDFRIFVNVCPTRKMSVDMMVWDHRAEQFVYRRNSRFARPREDHLQSIPVEKIKNQYLPDFTTFLKTEYYFKHG